MPPRVSPLKDAQKTIQSKTDNTNKLDVKYINAVKVAREDMEAPVTRDSNPDGPIASESADTRNAGPSNKPDINREAPVTRDSNPDGPIESESADTRNAGPSNKSDINRETRVHPGAEEPCTDAMTESDGDHSLSNRKETAVSG
ncbi:hypothetical protein KUCAC02_023482 [Chaenocephalus aceratus]|uniref:Uncharacterized protein n=1 Tax=Chaenocephalus aceratus TaxID=36190 RepID=A0ACB9XQ90_CHAAC|nr:hypothetical protein KUCAC02_023482 [Chaenocephalus aceratus]